jgi:hypothetical protein
MHSFLNMLPVDTGRHIVANIRFAKLYAGTTGERTSRHLPRNRRFYYIVDLSVHYEYYIHIQCCKAGHNEDKLR